MSQTLATWADQVAAWPWRDWLVWMFIASGLLSYPVSGLLQRQLKRLYAGGRLNEPPVQLFGWNSFQNLEGLGYVMMLDPRSLDRLTSTLLRWTKRLILICAVSGLAGIMLTLSDTPRRF